jgi:hypothetical protein
MTDNKQLITVTKSGISFEFDLLIESISKNGLYLPSILLYEMRLAGGTSGLIVSYFKRLWQRRSKTNIHDELTIIDRGYLVINSTNFIFAGDSKTISIPITRIERIQPYPDGIGIYQDGRQKEYRFIWGENIDMKLVGFSDDDGSIKPLTGIIISKYMDDILNQVTLP